MRKEKGITLIAVVVTIIVLIILAGITMVMLGGKNGVITQAEQAKIETKKAEYKEELQVIQPGLQVEKHMNNLTTRQVMEQYKTEIENNVKFQDAKSIDWKDEETIRVITKEGYVYDVTEEGVTYQGTQGEEPPPELEESDIGESIKPTAWTNKDVTVEIKIMKEEYKKYRIQYSLDGLNWINYTKQLVMTQNQVIYVKLMNELNELTPNAHTINIVNIDKLTPNNFTPTATSTTNSITLTGSTTDQAKTATDGSSGIAEYQFSKDNGVSWQTNSNKLQTNYTYTGLTQNQVFTLKMKAIDNAGNEIITNSITKNTGTVEGLDSSNVTFTYSPSSWTKGNVAVGITTTVTGYTLQYSTNGSTWSNYSSALTISDNQAIYARLFDGINAGGYATGNITNIDRLSPNNFTPTATSTTNSITLSGSTTDQAKTATNGSSGIKEYQFSKDNGASWQTNSNKLQTSYTYIGLAQNTVFTLKMKAIDNAGNEVITNAITKNTGSVTGLDSSNVTFTYLPSSWTKSTVSVGITTTVSGYTLQYSTNGTSWSNYTANLTISDNQAIYARLFDGTNAGGYATGNVTNIDRLTPNNFTPTATSTTNSITLSGSTTDQAATSTNGNSGIKEYQFSKDNGSTWQTNSNKLQTTYTYTGLAQNQVFTLKMKAIDNAGNEIITNSITKNTGTVAGLDSSNVTFTYSPSSWTKSTVLVGITTTVSGYILQYSTNGTSWSNDTSNLTISDNQAIYARLFDGTNAGGYATGNITNIDRLSPNNFTPTATSTTNSITLSGNTTDQATTSTNGNSGIKEYYFSKDNGATWQQNSSKLQTNYTYTGLVQNTVFTLKMKAIDNAGNEIITNAITKNTGTVTGLTGSNVTFMYTPSTWTKGNVAVGISTTVTGYTLQYSTNASTWTNYSSAINFTQNGVIYARLFDGTNAGGYATGNVANIDKLVPNNFTPTATSTTNSITLSGSTTDQTATSTNGNSGIKEYQFSKDNGSTWQTNSNKLQTTYTYTGLAQNMVFTLKMKAIDNGGNEVITAAITKNTGTVTGLTESNVTFMYTPSSWTKGNVTVGITTTVSGYTLQYSTNASTWNNYSSAVNFTQNGAIYARLFDGTNAGGYATGNVANIDKLTPNNFTPTAISTTNSITLSGSTTDQAATSTNGNSGIKEYYFSKDNGASWQQNSNKLQTSYIYTGLTQNQTFTLKMKAVDNAGNEIITGAITKATTGVPGGTITIDYTPKTWTNGNVSVTARTSSTGYTLQYSTNGSTWINYSSAITMTANGIIYARLFDGTNASAYTTANITNIDKTPPSIVTVNTNGYTSGTTTYNDVTLTLSATDNVGISYYQYSYDKVNVQGTASNPYKITQNGTWNLYFRAVDTVGNVGAWSNLVKVVKEARYHTITVRQMNENRGGGWDLLATKTFSIQEGSTFKISDYHNQFSQPSRPGGAVNWWSYLNASIDSYINASGSWQEAGSFTVTGSTTVDIHWSRHIYTIVSRLNSGYSINISGNIVANGTPIVLYPNGNEINDTAFHFKLYESEYGFFICSAYNGNFCVDVKDAEWASGAKIQLWQYNGGTAQQWVYGDPEGTMRVNFNGKAFDIKDGNPSAGLQLQTWLLNGSPAQAWDLRCIK